MSSKTTPKVISAVFCLPHRANFSNGKWEITSRRGTSALFDSLTYLSSVREHAIVGWTGEINSSHPEHLSISKNDRTEFESMLAKEDHAQIVPVWLFDDVDAKGDVANLKDQVRWRRYAEHELYTLFHYRQHEPTDGRVERLSWADYYRMNSLFADRILEVYKPGDIIWIHDYHLLLLPSMLRQRLPHAHIAFYLHIPFPSSEFLRCLSRRKEILEGMLGSNLVGFQSYGYCRHFVSCCKRILHFESSPAGVDAYGAHVAVDAFPIGIAADATEKTAFGHSSVNEKLIGIREMYAGKKIIVGRDRLDTVRGVAQKLQAFEIFLEKYPEWRDQVVLIQVTSPTSVEEEKEDSSHKIANKISELVSRINGTYGSLSFSPVQHYPQYISRDEYFALLRVADVGLITSVRDGMNTTSLEYVICQKENFGPLILSEFSGTAGNLSNAMHINPWDLGGVASAIDEALRMPLKERKAQHEKLYERVTTNTVQAWSKNYLERLETTISSFGQSEATPVLDKSQLLAQFRRAQRRLFMFDYDGTLTPIVKDPQAAIPSDRVIRTLKTLAADPKNAVWIISGRDQAFLDEWMGHITELGLSAEHGSFIRHPQEDVWENMTAQTDMSWQMDVMDIFQHYTEKTQGSFIERKKVALTWHYRRADPEYGAHQARECQQHLQNTVEKKYDVEVMTGKANLEVRPTFVNKGEIVKRLVREYGEDSGDKPAQGAPDFVFCLGDDFTDEDMFDALNHSGLPKETVFACTVGASSKQTKAQWHLLEPSDVISSLGMLNGNVDDGNVGAIALVEGTVPETR